MQFDFFKGLFARSPLPLRPATPAPRVQPPTAARARHSSAATLLAEARTLLVAAGASALAARVQVRWNPRMRSTAGMAYPGKALVTLNPRLREFGDEEIARTLRHELAHLLAHDRAGRRRIAPHGAEWRRACRDLGLVDEKRTHDLPLPRRAVTRRHHYRCPACGVQVARVKPLRRDSACLACCRAHNRGRYDARFRFIKLPPSG
jgi:predicted SprT family Zn-dependent metalloprotease